MKLNSYLSIVCTALLLFVSSHDDRGQSTDKNASVISRKTSDERRIERFVNRFFRILDKTKDLGKIPPPFFAKGFRNNVVNSAADDGVSYKSERKQLLSFDQQFRFKMQSFNFYYLLVVAQSADEKNDRNPADFLPVDAAAALKASWIWAELFELNESDEKKTERSPKKSDLLAAIESMQTALKLFRLHLEKENPAVIAARQRNITAWRKKFSYYAAKKCAKDDCYGLPPQTTLFGYSAFPFYFDMIKIDGRMKILNLLPNFGD